jgi:Fe-S cluster assembly ATPase SufC
MNKNSPMLEIKDLQVSINGNQILKKFKFNY